MRDDKEPQRLMHDGCRHRFYLMRHGETDWNRTFRYQGSSDVELNEIGCGQARRLGWRMTGIAPERVLASPLQRAFRTAEIVMEQNYAKVAVEACDDLREISFGCWEGLSALEVEARDPETFAAWRDAPFSVPPRGGEALEAICARSTRFAKNLLAGASPDGTTFVVAHGAILRTLLSAILGIDDMKLLWRLRFDNCSVTALDLWGARPSLLLLNDTTHVRLTAKAEIARLKFPA